VLDLQLEVGQQLEVAARELVRQQDRCALDEQRAQRVVAPARGCRCR
jgi:hypothetical protein